MVDTDDTFETVQPHLRGIEILGIVMFWIVYMSLPIMRLFLVSPPGAQIPTKVIYWSVYGVVYLGITLLVFRLCHELHPSKVGWIGSIGGHVLLLLVVTISSDLIMDWGQAVLVRQFVADPGETELATPLDIIRNLSFIKQLFGYNTVLLAGLARDFFLRYTNKQARAHELEQRAQELETQLTGARLEALRRKINPHFLFNTLHAINTMAGTNPDGVRRATKRLAGLLRYVLNADDAEVPVSQELGFLRSYLEIQKLRLKDHLETELHVDEEVERALIPALILQPLVENAIRHGVQEIEGTGKVRVSIEREGQILVLCVDDNGPGVEEEGEGEGSVGLDNIRERLDELYGGAARLTLMESDVGGCRVLIRLPYHTEQDPYFESVAEPSGRQLIG